MSEPLFPDHPRISGKRDRMEPPGLSAFMGELYERLRFPPLPSATFSVFVRAVSKRARISEVVAPVLLTGSISVLKSVKSEFKDVNSVFNCSNPMKKFF